MEYPAPWRNRALKRRLFCMSIPTLDVSFGEGLGQNVIYEVRVSNMVRDRSVAQVSREFINHLPRWNLPYILCQKKFGHVRYEVPTNSRHSIICAKENGWKIERGRETTDFSVDWFIIHRARLGHGAAPSPFLTTFAGRAENLKDYIWLGGQHINVRVF